MSGFLVDTNVISEVLRPAPDAQVIAWSQNVPKDFLFLSVVSMGEFRKGLPCQTQGSLGQTFVKSLAASRCIQRTLVATTAATVGSNAKCVLN